jgi:hypothetical protein
MPALRFGMALHMAAHGGFPSCPSPPSWSCLGEAAMAVTALGRRKRYAGRRQRSESHLFPKCEFGTRPGSSNVCRRSARLRFAF